MRYFFIWNKVSTKDQLAYHYTGHRERISRKTGSSCNCLWSLPCLWHFMKRRPDVKHLPNMSHTQHVLLDKRLRVSQICRGTTNGHVSKSVKLREGIPVAVKHAHSLLGDHNFSQPAISKISSVSMKYDISFYISTFSGSEFHFLIAYWLFIFLRHILIY